MSKLIKSALLMAAVGVSLAASPALAAGKSAIAGDPAAGRGKTAACAACHGADGNSAAADYPKLAGQGEKYLVKQLKDIRSGARPVPVMTGQLDGMSEQDLADIAAYYASKAVTIGQADPELVALGETIYRGGIRERGIPACAACHAPDGSGVAAAGFPLLSGQHAKYTAQQLQMFRAAADGDDSGRKNDGDELRTMRTIAFRMSDREIEAVASFVQGLH